MSAHIEQRGVHLIPTSLTSVDGALARYQARTLEPEPNRAPVVRN